jgi:hypothetical protein
MCSTRSSKDSFSSLNIDHILSISLLEDICLKSTTAQSEDEMDLVTGNADDWLIVGLNIVLEVTFPGESFENDLSMRPI